MIEAAPVRLRMWFLQSSMRAADAQGRPTTFTCGLVVTAAGPRLGYRFGPYGHSLALVNATAVRRVLRWHQEAITGAAAEPSGVRRKVSWYAGDTVPAVDAYEEQSLFRFGLAATPAGARPIYQYGQRGVTLVLTEPDAVAQVARWHWEAVTTVGGVR